MIGDTRPAGWQRIVLIVLRIVLGIAFLAAGLSKLLGAPMMVQEFARFAPYGLGQWFRYLTGAIEIVGALLLVRPRTISAGAVLLACVSVGALVAQIVVLRGDPVHAAVFALLLGWIATAYRGARAPALDIAPRQRNEP